MSKKTFLVGAVLSILAACNSAQAGPITEEPALDVEKPYSSVSLWIDPDTGCQYLLYSHYNQGGITPRLSQQGTVICGR